MIRLLAAVLLLAYSHFGWAMAYPEDYTGVPHGDFQEGEVIDHTKFNQNNLSIKEAINDRVPVPSNCSTNQIIKYDGGGWVCTNMPADGASGADGAAAGLSCTTDQIIKWDGTNDLWVCATDPFAGLNCDVGDQLRMGSGGWECRAEPITASLIQNDWERLFIGSISAYFDSVNNVDPVSSCDDIFCFIEVIGVTDHSSCVTQVTGGAVSGSAYVNIFATPSEIVIGDINTWNEGQAVYINISCTP